MLNYSLNILGVEKGELLKLSNEVHVFNLRIQTDDKKKNLNK